MPDAAVVSVQSDEACRTLKTVGKNLEDIKTLSGHPDLNREPPAPKAGALPLEPCPECVYCSNFRRFSEQKNKRRTRPKKERRKKAKPAHRARVYRYCAGLAFR